MPITPIPALAPERASTVRVAGPSVMRAVTRWAIDPRWTAKAYVGLFHQPPQPEALDHTFGNPAVGLERAVHAGLGAEWRPGPLWPALAPLRRDVRPAWLQGT